MPAVSPCTQEPPERVALLRPAPFRWPGWQLLLLPSPGLPAWHQRAFPPPARRGRPEPWARPGPRLRSHREHFPFPAQGCPWRQAPPAARCRPQRCGHRQQARRPHGCRRTKSVRSLPPASGSGNPERSGKLRRIRPAQGSPRRQGPVRRQQALPHHPPWRPEHHQLYPGHRPEPQEQRPPSFPAGALPHPAPFRLPERPLLLLPPPELPAWHHRAFPPPARRGRPEPWARPGHRLRSQRKHFPFPAQGCPGRRAPPAGRRRPQAALRAHQGACRPSG